MFRGSTAVRTRRGRRGLAVVGLVAALLAPTATAFAGDGWGRGRGWDRRDRDCGYERSRHGYRSHGHSRGYSHHGGSHVGIHIGLPPIVIGGVIRDRCDPVVVRERVVVREPYCPPAVVVREPYCPPTVIVREPVCTPAVIVTRPAQPSQTVIVSSPEPVVVTARTTPLPPRVVVAPPPVAQPAPEDVAPAELTMSAYRTGDSVMVMIGGTNTGKAFATSLVAGDLSAASPTVVLHNAPVTGAASTGDTAFTVNVALRVAQGASPATVTVRVADRTHVVPVGEVPSLE